MLLEKNLKSEIILMGWVSWDPLEYKLLNKGV